MTQNFLFLPSLPYGVFSFLFQACLRKVWLVKPLDADKSWVYQICEATPLKRLFGADVTFQLGCSIQHHWSQWKCALEFGWVWEWPQHLCSQGKNLGHLLGQTVNVIDLLSKKSPSVLQSGTASLTLPVEIRIWNTALCSFTASLRWVYTLYIYIYVYV